ncbi:hypothetical protein [Nitrosospira sp. NRS527]|uniref:hypothetical protein n=1 Tax=Nitrosospira sp. NRS527 TaxID=155925 RepID=UPI001AF18B95|nr:hypothetical protein [Nitrosospira sp. NRS527]BCT69530.1 hypothetical protein NNRS527_03155 [Nitrosospira sp. NRS527]
MDPSMIFVITLGIVSGLAGYVAYRMFAVPPRPQYDMSKMYFAAAVLAFLAFIFMLSMIVYAFGPEPKSPSIDSPGKTIFDSCVKIIPPLVTLIIGFYFGTSQGIKEPAILTEKAVVQKTAPGTSQELNESTSSTEKAVAPTTTPGK